MMRFLISIFLRLMPAITLFACAPQQAYATHNNSIEQERLLMRLQQEAAALQSTLSELTPNAKLPAEPYVVMIPGGSDQAICSRFQIMVDQMLAQEKFPEMIMAGVNYRVLDETEALDADLPERTEASLIAYRWQQHVEKHQQLKAIHFLLLDFSKMSAHAQ